MNLCQVFIYIICNFIKELIITKQDLIDLINDIEAQCDKEINVIRFAELNSDDIKEIVFVPDFYYDIEEGLDA